MHPVLARLDGQRESLVKEVSGAYILAVLIASEKPSAGRRRNGGLRDRHGYS
jgi:hypothetical protein